MYVRAEMMPHQIRIIGIRCERLRDISDASCLKEGIRVEYEEDIIPKYYYFDAKQQKKVWFDTSRRRLRLADRQDLRAWDLGVQPVGGGL